MTAKTDLLPLPGWLATNDGAAGVIGAEGIPIIRRAMKDYARANVAHATAPLQAEIEALREALDWTVQQNDELLNEGRELTARAERLAEALRGIETKPVHSMDHARSSLERKRAMSECADAARAALEQEGGNG